MNLSLNKKTIVFAIILLLGGLVGVSLSSVRVRNVLGLQSVGSVACYTGSSVATTSYSFMSRGAGTTTLSCLTQTTDTLAVNVQLAASSTQTRYRYRKECSYNNRDWYAQVAELNELATSTDVTSNFVEQRLRFASSTDSMTGGTTQDVNFSGYGTTTTLFINLNVDACSQDYTRLVFYLDNDTKTAYSTTTNGAIKAIGIVKEEITR